MTFLWPWALLIPALAAPALVAVWVFAERRRARHTVAFTNVDLIGAVVPNPPGRRRLIPPILGLIGVLVVLVGVARPAARVSVASAQSTVMLAIDVSLSMEATDFDPSRIEAAKAAAREFLAGAPASVRVGLVSFAGTARVLVPPTTDRESVARALTGLQTDQGTAIGEGIVTSLQALGATPGAGATGNPPATPSASILLLSDGENTVGRDPAYAAEQARAAGVPVSTVAIGTPDGRIIVRGTPVTVTVNEAQLRSIASTTDGQFFAATSGSDLASVYRNLSREIAREIRLVEVTALFAFAGAALVIAAAVIGLIWLRHFP